MVVIAMVVEIVVVMVVGGEVSGVMGRVVGGRVSQSASVPRLAGDEIVEIERAAAHVRQDLHGRRGRPVLVRRCGLLVFVVLVQHPLQDGAVPLRDFPVAAHLRQRLDKHEDVRADGVGDRRPMH